MEKKKIKLWILHAGIEHISPYFYNFCLEMDNHKEYEYVIDPKLPLDEKVEKGIVYFNRLKRFYDSEDMKTAKFFLKDINKLKNNGWKIVWTLHNFYPIDRKISDVDEYITKEFLNKCDLVFSVSNYMVNSIKKEYKINAINHGMGINTLYNTEPHIDTSFINKKDFVFTFIGNIYKYKMLDKVVEAFNKLDNCKLIIAGRESKNAGVEIEKIINKNPNIYYINQFIDDNGWKDLSKITDIFISIYDLNLPAFKFGFFPSNYINISRTGIKCISPKCEVIDEMISDEQMIYYDFDDDNGIYKSMLKALSLSKKKIPIKLKYNYSWNEVIDVFVENCNKLFK